MARKTSPSPILTSILTWLVAAYIRLLYRTGRWTFEGAEHFKELAESGRPFICAGWHSRLCMMPHLTKLTDRQFMGLISGHSDGEIIAQVMRRFNIESRRGSAADPRKPEKNKGGASALKALVSDIRRGMMIGITPDGPRGPRQHAQLGVAQLARLTGAPIIPVTYSARRAVLFNSWDRFMLPLPIPFSKGLFIFDEPIEMPESGKVDTEALRLQIEQRLNTITAEADRRMGRESIAPAAAPTALEDA